MKFRKVGTSRADLAAARRYPIDIVLDDEPVILEFIQEGGNRQIIRLQDQSERRVINQEQNDGFKFVTLDELAATDWHYDEAPITKAEYDPEEWNDCS